MELKTWIRVPRESRKLLLVHQRIIFWYYLHIMDPQVQHRISSLAVLACHVKYQNNSWIFFVQALVLVRMIYVEKIGNWMVMVIMVTQVIINIYIRAWIVIKNKISCFWLLEIITTVKSWFPPFQINVKYLFSSFQMAVYVLFVCRIIVVICLVIFCFGGHVP